MFALVFSYSFKWLFCKQNLHLSRSMQPSFFHLPMYSFLSGLTLIDIYFTSCMTPKFINNLWLVRKVIQLHAVGLCYAFLWNNWNINPDRHCLWLLCGLQQSSPQHGHHEQDKMPLLILAALLVRQPTSFLSFPLQSCCTFVTPNWPLLLWKLFRDSCTYTTCPFSSFWPIQV